MADERDELPVLTVIDKDGYMVEAGEPGNISNSQIEDYLNEGCEIKIIQFKEYAAKPRNWVWNKPEQKKLL